MFSAVNRLQKTCIVSLGEWRPDGSLRALRTKNCLRINDMISPGESAKARAAEWLDKHRHAVLYDDENSTLLDVASSKSIRLAWKEVKAFEEKIHPETRDDYLVLLFENGTQVAQVDPGGIAFPPLETNSGPLRDGPAEVCLKDFQTLKGRIDHYLHDHREEPPPRECLDLIMLCIAIPDGARAVGFDVGDMEGELERSLREIERRSS
jgi:hypothetical protein